MQFISDRSSLKRATSFIYLVEVVSENGRISYFATRSKSTWDGLQSSCPSHFSQAVHVFRACIFQECFSTKSFNGVVSHSVAQYDDMFQCDYILAIDMMLANTPAAV